jgi:hypothetical protein
MEQIDGHRISLNRRVARGLAHGLISCGQSHKMIICDFGYMAPDQAQSTFQLLELQKIGGLSSTALGNPKTQNVKSRFGIPATGTMKDKGLSSTASGITET